MERESGQRLAGKALDPAGTALPLCRDVMQNRMAEPQKPSKKSLVLAKVITVQGAIHINEDGPCSRLLLEPAAGHSDVPPTSGYTAKRRSD
jgi:hypothetical protein